MSLKMPETASEQAERGEKSRADAADAWVKREMSITHWANDVFAGGRQNMDSARRIRDEGVYILPAEEMPAGAAINTERLQAPDGYVRLSPVQEIAVPSDYRIKLIRKWVLCTAGIVAAGVLLYVLYVGIIGF